MAAIGPSTDSSRNLTFNNRPPNPDNRIEQAAQNAIAASLPLPGQERPLVLTAQEALPKVEQLLQLLAKRGWTEEDCNLLKRVVSNRWGLSVKEVRTHFYTHLVMQAVEHLDPEIFKMVDREYLKDNFQFSWPNFVSFCTSSIPEKMANSLMKCVDEGRPIEDDHYARAFDILFDKVSTCHMTFQQYYDRTVSYALSKGRRDIEGRLYGRHIQVRYC